ncbi:MAG: hypothetical protein HYR56_15550 [Acidobacteria bacterium]|nr:hypothetical protein [Acidobacteriota bacterium]MBI3423111.1 hypothetical protein [Acidobacteriota bacterium]
MRTSRKLTHVLLAMMTLALLSVASLAADPGSPYPATSEVSDQKAGSTLIYNIYTSNASGGNTQNTRVNITNTNLTNQAFVHLFFVSADCTIADSYVCLTAAQTASFLASDVDPGTKGYIVAVAVNNLGCPVNFNFLIGDEYVKFASGHAANLGAEAFAAIGDLPCDPNQPSVDINFSGATGGYNKLPRALAVSNFPSRADGNDTMIIVNAIRGSYAIGASSTGTLFGVIYDDAETGFSFSLNGACQVMGSLADSFPRTTPRLSQIVPAGRSGWLKLYNLTTDIGILGTVINFNASANAQANAFNGGRNMHKLTLTTGTTTVTLPVFPPSC